MKISQIGELGLIKRISSKMKYDRTVVRGIGDDTAVIEYSTGKYLLFTCDMLIEDVHFKNAQTTPFQIGWKAMARNLSDIAAMGGLPKYAIVSLGIDPKLSVSYADGIFEGLYSAARRFKVNIVGGDTSRSKKTVIDVSVIGEVEKDKLTLRSSAKTGDAVFVTGFLGGSIKGKHLSFTPRVEIARELVKKFKVNAMIDISDGLLLDLWRVLEASGKGAIIYEDLIPVSDKADSLKNALTDGEDFELLFTMSPKEAERFIRHYSLKFRVPVSLIGEIIPMNRGFKMIGKDWKEKIVNKKGFLHF